MKHMALSAVIVKAYPLISAPIFLYFFTNNEFGALDFAYYVMSLSCVLLTLGLHNGYARYALDTSFEYDLSSKKFSYLLVSTFFILFLTLIFLLIFNIFDLSESAWMPADLLTHQQSFVLYIISGALAYSAIIAERFSLNFRMLIAITIAIYILPLITLIILFYSTSKIDLHLVFFYQSIFNFLAFIISFCKTIRKIEINKLTNIGKKYFTYSFPLLFVLVSESFIYFAGRLFLTRLYPDTLGDFAIAGRVASISLILNFFIAFMFHPYYYRDYNKPKFQKFWNALYNFFIACYCFIITLAPWFMIFIWKIFNKEIDLDMIISIILILTANFYAGLQIFHLGMHVKEKTSAVGLIYLVTIPIAALLNLLLITRYQAIGASLALLGTMIFISIPYIYFSNRNFKHKLNTNFHAKILVFCTIGSSTLFTLTSDALNLNQALPFLTLVTILLISTIKNAGNQYNEYKTE